MFLLARGHVLARCFVFLLDRGIIFLTRHHSFWLGITLSFFYSNEKLVLCNAKHRATFFWENFFFFKSCCCRQFFTIWENFQSVSVVCINELCFKAFYMFYV
jgi:hypothetical protein